MNRRIVLAASLLLACPVLYATGTRSLELFGVALGGATRDELQQVLQKQGLRPVKVDKNLWGDTYDARGVLEGASKLYVGYVRDDLFAVAEYTFESFMDTRQVDRVIQMVSTKYGRPSSVQGDVEVGPVSAVWKLNKGGRVEVARGWPNTTTYLRLIDSAAYARMQAEMDSDRKAETEKKAKAQSKAF